MKEIRRYIGTFGEVKVVEYDETGKPEYYVVHGGIPGSATWYREKRDAIVHAQFLAAKY